MKRIILLTLSASLLACGKGNKSCREGSGGFIPNFYRVFYKTKNFGGGPITVEFTNKESGGPSTASVRLEAAAIGGSDCNATSGVVKARFTTGYDYTYRAYDNSRQWTGTIPASCTTNSCEAIELQ